MPDECDACPFAACDQCPCRLSEAGARMADEAETYANTETP